MSVVAVKKNKKSWTFAADSIAISADLKITDKFSKLKKVNDMVIGSTGTLEEGSLLFLYARNHKPLSSQEKDVMDFFCEFYKWQRELTGNFFSSNRYLFGFDGKVFYIENAMVKEINDYYAIGAGANFAFATLYLGHSAEQAVQVSCALSCFVADPIVTEELPLMTKENNA